MQIHIARDGKHLGPFSLEEVNQQLATGTLSLSDNAWSEGASGWAPLSTIPGVSAGVAAAPPPPGRVVNVNLPPATDNATRPVLPAGSSATTEPLAIMSLIFSVLGLCGFCCWLLFLLAIAGVVCGHIALPKIKNNPGLKGHELALVGIILGYIALAIWLTLIVVFGGLAAFGSFMDATKN